MMGTESELWRPCSTCKKSILTGGDYLVCSVSTCNRKRTGLVFCSMSCWSAHVPTMGHRDPWAEERRAPVQREPVPGPLPSFGALPQPTAPSRPSIPPRRRIVEPSRQPHPPQANASAGARPPALVTLAPDAAEDVLVVVSKLKAYIRARSGMNTAASTNEALSDLVRELCDDAIQMAAADERKTVMGRDFPGKR